MDKKIQSFFRFDNYRIETIEFNFNPLFDSKQVEYDFDLDYDIHSQRFDGEIRGIVKLQIHLFKDAPKYNLPFELFVSIVGMFSAKNMKKEKFDKMLETNGTTALFPFLRSTISDITKTANVPTLLLPLVNIHMFLEDKKRKNNK